jgi:hypothetical protein
MNGVKPYFAEENGDWQSIPEWVNFLIRFGYCWRKSEHQGRRVALVSMPCASPGAGFIALGAMISDLCNGHANTTNSHKEALFEYASQYLDHCRDCPLVKCDPLFKKCGYDQKSTGIIRSIRRANHLYLVSDQTDHKSKKLVLKDKNGKNAREINPEYICNLYVDGQPPAVSSSGEASLSGDVYQDLIDEAQICTANLKKSYSGLVLAGRAKGESDTRAAYEAVHFSSDTASHTLAGLLAIHGWAAPKVSRTAFYNTRTEQLDRDVALPRLVVSDGDSSFLKSVDRFIGSDVIGVIDRSLDRDRLELIGQKIGSLKSWYQTDTEFQGLLPIPVPGISITILKKQ